MKAAQARAFTALKKAGAPVFEREDQPDTFLISAEDSGADGHLWADYYSGYEAPEIDEVLVPLGLFAEWENPGALIVYRA